MKRRIVPILCSLVASIFAVLIFVMPAQAKEVTVEATKFGSSTSNISASLTYDDTIVEGTPTVFTINSSGCSRQPEFLFNALTRKNGSSYEKVIDLSYKGFSTNNSLEEQLHFSGTYKLRFYIYVFGDWREDGTRLPLESQAFEVEFTMTAAAQIESADTIINRVVADCNAQGFTTQYEKALWLNDWIIDYADYDKGLTHSGADSLFIDRTGTCEAYHGAYTILLNRVGIETRRVDWGGHVNHVWTGAKLDGKWYNIDTTWNDNDKFSYGIDTQHLYFAVPTEAMRCLRPEWDGTYNAGDGKRYAFDATDYEGNYFIKTGTIRTWSDVYAQSSSGDYSVKAHLDKKETSFSLPVEKAYWADNYINSVYPLVAYQLTKTDWGGDVSKLDCKLQGKELVFTVTYKSSTSGSTTSGSSSSSSDNSGNTSNSGNSNNSGSSSSSSSNSGNSSSSGNSGASATATPPAVSGMWVRSGNRWWFQYDSATKASQKKNWPANEWVVIGGKRYHFDSNGWMHVGWQWLGNSWYYLGGTHDGSMKTGWCKVGGKWYFMDKSTGKMKTGWIDDGGKRYHLGSSGAMHTGWQKISNVWYYFSGSGAMTTGWQRVGGKWYFMDKSTGKMKTGWIDDGGARYYLRSSGAMATGWLSLGGKWYFLNGSGSMAKNRWISGKYWVGANGVMATSEWVDNNRYYVDGNGVWVPNARR